MASRTLEVQIIGDASNLQRSFGSAGKSTSSFGKSLLKTAAIAGTAIAGYKAVSSALVGSVKAAMDAEASQAKVQTMLKNAGISWKEHGKRIDETIQKHSQLTGFDDEELAESFANMIRTTGNLNESFKLNALAADIARSKGMDLAGAQSLLARVYNGSFMGVKRLGIGLQTVTTAQDALKESTKKATDEQVKAAKEQDKMATRQAAIAALQKSFGGQAEAYGQTMTGAVDRMNVAWENLQETLGSKLLPLLTPLIIKITNFINAAIESEKLKRVMEVVADATRLVVDSFVKLARAAAQHWGEIKVVVQSFLTWYKANVAPTIESVHRNVIRIWDQMGSDMQNSLKGHISRMPPIVQAQMKNFAGVITATLAVLRGDWSTAWKEISAIPGRTLMSIVNSVRLLAGTFYAAAKSLGAAIVRGVVDGLSSLAVSVKNKIIGGIQSAIDAAMGVFGHSPQEMIGVVLIDGIVRGWNKNTLKLKQEMIDKVNDAIDAAQQAVLNRRDALGSVFGEFVDNALAAFDKLTEGMQTASEKALKAFDLRQAAAEAKKEMAALVKAVADAQIAIQKHAAEGVPQLTRTEGETDEEFFRRQEEARQQFNEEQARLVADYNNAQAALDDERHNRAIEKQRAALEKQAAKERAALEDRRALQRRHMEEELTALENSYERGRISYRQYHERLLAILKEYHVPIRKNAAALGSALAEGLRDSLDEVEKAARELANTIARQLQNITVTVKVATAGTPHNPAKRQHGGPVLAGMPYVVGERGRELFVPSQSGKVVPNNALATVNGGSSGVHIHFHGGTFIGGNKERVALELRDALVRAGYRNAGGMLKGLA